MKARPILITATLAFAASADAAPPDSTLLLTRPSGFGQLTVGFTNDSWTGIGTGVADGSGRQPASANGRFVVFVSDADGLATDDLDSVSNVYVRDNLMGTTSLVSRAPGVLGEAANGPSDDPVISGDGEWVAFSSQATNLSDADEAGVQHVFKRSLITGQTVLVDRESGAAGDIAGSGARAPSISENGARVAFSSTAKLTDPSAPTDVEQVYVREGDTTQLVSTLNASTTPGGERSREPSISADGTRVAFTSEEELLSADDTNAFTDIYVRTLGTTTTELISRQTAPGSLVGNGNSESPAIASDDNPSADYRVAFVTQATNLIPSGDSSGDRDVYVRTNAVTTVLASRATGAAGTEGDQPSLSPSISDDGTRVAFLTDSANLATGADANGLVDLYVRNLDTSLNANTTTLASRGVGSAVGGSPSPGGAIGPNGNFVYFESFADNLHPDDDNDFMQVFRRSLVVPSIVEPTLWISRPSAGGPFRSGTNDSTSRNFRRTFDGPKTVSEDGRFVVFASHADELSAEDDNRYMNVFVRDTLTGDTTLVSRASGSGAAANESSGPAGAADFLIQGLSPGTEAPAISANGRVVAFTSLATNLVPGDGNGVADVFVRDLVTGVTELASRTEDGSVATQASAQSTLSADGTKVAFSSGAQLVAADDTAFQDVYVRDLAQNTTSLVSRQTGANGAEGNAGARDPAISADGTRVAFVTNATNLAPSLVDGNGVSDVYLRDLGANTTTPVSARNVPLLSTGNGPSRSPAISADGTRVAFESASNDIVGAGDLNGVETDVFVRDLLAGTTTLASRGSGGFGGNQGSTRPSISADGNIVAFESQATDLHPLANSGLPTVFARNLAAGTTELVSRADGAGGAAPNRSAGNAAISANGRCVAFDSAADNLIPGGPPGTDFIRTYMRVLSGECPNDPPETAIDSGPAGPTGDSTPSFGLSSDEPGSIFSCRVDAADFAPCGSPLTLGAVADGAHTVEARATDPAGNTDASPASRSFSVDTRRPAVTGLRVRPGRFRVSGSGSRDAATRPRRVVIGYTLSEAARVTLQVERPRPGRRAGGRCRRPTPRLHSRPRCVRWLRVGSLGARAARAGANRVRFNGRVRRRALRAGPYRVTATAVDAVGNSSRPRSAPFRVRGR